LGVDYGTSNRCAIQADALGIRIRSVGRTQDTGSFRASDQKNHYRGDLDLPATFEGTLSHADSPCNITGTLSSRTRTWGIAQCNKVRPACVERLFDI